MVACCPIKERLKFPAISVTTKVPIVIELLSTFTFFSVAFIELCDCFLEESASHLKDDLCSCRLQQVKIQKHSPQVKTILCGQ